MLDPQKTPHTSPLRASYGVSFVNICVKNDHVITGLHCICWWLQSESVDLALQLLDGLDWRGYKVCVEKAKFEMKGAYDPKKKKKKLSNKQKRDMKERQDKWVLSTVVVISRLKRRFMTVNLVITVLSLI